MNWLILVFVVGLFPSWTDAEITDAYWKTQEALVFLHQYGIEYHQPGLSMIGAPLDEMTWNDAVEYTRGLGRELPTMYLVLRPVNWWREGYALPDHVAVGYRAQMQGEWSYFTALVAHELLHTLGATDKYFCDEHIPPFCRCTGEPDIMCNLRRYINQDTRREITEGY